MKIELLCPSSQPELQEILYKALIRSFTRSQVIISSIESLTSDEKTGGVWVVANALEDWGQRLSEHINAGYKIVLFGAIPNQLASHLDVTILPFDPSLADDVACPPATTYSKSESKAVIHYQNVHAHLGMDAPLSIRPCRRYDFTNEWNNLGYGAVAADGSIWSIAQSVQCTKDACIAEIRREGKPHLAYAAHWQKQGHLLWFNRPVGPIDSQEWRLVERYISSVGGTNTPCIPCVSEIPAGYDAAVTMRLDCDEDITSAKTLHNLYVKESIPFSLALTTKLLADSEHLAFLQTVLEHRGALLSHSVNHPVNWGTDYDTVLMEATQSCSTIRNTFPSARIDYAVSPFHQNPRNSIPALEDSGLKGFIGGIIANDPEYCMARGGEVAFGTKGIISHSQQCMLHGDCMLADGDPLAIYKQSFEITTKAGALFGYLDHPFSPRYAYGWRSEEQRTSMHQELIRFIRSYGNVLFLSENDALDWIRHKTSAQVTVIDDHVTLAFSITNSLPFQMKIEYRGQEIIPIQTLL